MSIYISPIAKSTKHLDCSNSDDLTAIELFLSSKKASVAVIEPIFWSKSVMHVLPHNFTNGKTTASILEKWSKNLNKHFLCSFFTKDGFRGDTECVNKNIHALITNINDLFTIIALINDNKVILVGYDLKPLLITFKRLGSSPPARQSPFTSFKKTWDILVADRALNLGNWHKKYSRLSEFTALSNDPKFNLVEAHEFIESNPPWEFDINSVALRYGSSAYRSRDELYHVYSYLSGKNLQPTHGHNAVYSYFFSQHTDIVKIYEKQKRIAKTNNLLTYLTKTEFKWTNVLATIEFNGFSIDKDRIKSYKSSISKAKRNLVKSLGRLNVKNFDTVIECNNSIGAILNKNAIENINDVSYNSIVQQTSLRKFDKVDCKKLDKLVKHKELLSLGTKLELLSNYSFTYDNSIHPVFIQFGQSTGRDNVESTNSPTISRSLRKIVVPRSGFGIMEADYSQFEPNIAACVHKDIDLINAINTYQDVYAYVAYLLAHGEKTFISKVQPRVKDVGSFVETNAKLRSVAKTCLIGLFNGITQKGLENELGDLKQAESAYKLIRSLFSTTFTKIEEINKFVKKNGYVQLMSGLRRYRPTQGAYQGWEKRWVANFPLQGTGAVIFKSAGIRLNRYLAKRDAKIIIPLHDAFIIEAPLDQLEAVGAAAQKIMVKAFKDYFPSCPIEPKVSLNLSHPGSWYAKPKDLKGEYLSEILEKK